MPQKIDHKQRENRIADAAVSLFSKVGYENTSLIMIASAANISRTALYQYFSNKREVLDAAILSVTDGIARTCTQVLTKPLTATQRLEEVCHTVVDVMFENKEFLVAVFDFVIGMVRANERMGPSIAHFTGGTRKAIKHLISLGKRRGECASELDADMTADVIYSEFESCAMRIVLGTEKSPKHARARFSAIIRTLALSA